MAALVVEMAALTAVSEAVLMHVQVHVPGARVVLGPVPEAVLVHVPEVVTAVVVAPAAVAAIPAVLQAAGQGV